MLYKKLVVANLMNRRGSIAPLFGNAKIQKERGGLSRVRHSVSLGVAEKCIRRPQGGGQ